MFLSQKIKDNEKRITLGMLVADKLRQDKEIKKKKNTNSILVSFFCNSS